jgi:hypothetical protein
MKTACSVAQFASLVFCLLICYQAAPALQASSRRANSTRAAHKKTSRRQRILDFLERAPIPRVVSSPAAAPLTANEKLRLAVDGFANPIAVIEDAAKAQFYRAWEPEKKIGHGTIGYARQFGAAYLDTISGSTFSTFLYPTLLHQDPRYFREGKGRVLGRVLYSISRVFVGRGDGDQREFNWSQVLGSASVTALSTRYYPRRERESGIIATNLGWAILGDAGTNLYNEFWPDFSHWLSKKWKKGKGDAGAKPGFTSNR